MEFAVTKAAVIKMTRRTYYFLLYVVSSLILFHGEIAALAALAWNDNRYSHIIVVPFVSLGLVYIRRQSLPRDVPYSFRPALLFAALAALLYSLAIGGGTYLGQYGRLTVAASAIVATWVAGFVFFYGIGSGRAAMFPLAMLLLSIPIAPAIVEVAEVALQRGSAEVTHVLFRLTATPVFRQDLIFSLPGLTIEVAEECSGIRSGISLLITALVLSYLFLRSGWTKACCILLTVPIAILKNAVRITTLSMLGVYVSPDYLHGPLHHRGGPLFSILSLALLLAGLWLLRKAEDGSARGKQSIAESTARIDKAQPTRAGTPG
jgi:exosortase